MKKQIFSVAALAVASVLATPAIIASKVEKNTLAVIEQINALPFCKAEIVDSVSGYLNSSTELKLSIDFNEITAGIPSDMPFDDLSLGLVVNVAHAPLLSSGTDLMRFDITVKEPEQLAHLDWDRAQSLYHVVAQYSLFGNISYQDKSPKITYQDSDGIRFEMAAYEGQARTIDGKLTHQGKLPKVSFESRFIAMSLKNMVIDTRLEQPLGDYFNQDKAPQYFAKLDIEHTDINVIEQNKKVGLNHLAMAVTSLVDDAKHVINNEIVYSLDSIKADEFTANNLEVALQLNNLDEPTYVEFNKLLSSSEFNSDPEQQLTTITTFLESSLLKILAPEPELNITSVKGEFAEGHFAAKLNSKLANIEQLPETLTDIPFWLQHLDANSHIEVAKPLAINIAKLVIGKQMASSGAFASSSEDEIAQLVEQQATGFVAMLESQGTLVAKEQNYIVDFELKNSSAKLNGKAIPLPISQ